MTEKPLITAILPVNDLHGFLRASLDSVLAQTLANFELIVIGNGLSPEQQGQLANWIGELGDRRVRLECTEIRYLPFALNLGLHLARAEFIARCDSDDLWDCERFALQHDFLVEHADVDVVGSQFHYIDADDEVLASKVALPLTDGGIRRWLPWVCPLAHPSVMFRKAVVSAAGGYMLGRYSEDYDLWIRLATENGARFANLPQALLRYRRHGAQVTGKANLRAIFAYNLATKIRAFIGGAGWRYLIGAFTPGRMGLRIARLHAGGDKA